MPGAAVTLQGVHKHYGNVHVVRGVDLAIAPGEFLVLVGPSGCGKSTLLRMIAGLESISDGTVSIGTRVVNAVPPAERDIGMVFQSYALYPHMRVRDNLAFGLTLRKTPAAEIAARVKSTAAMLDLGALLDRFPKELSGGQRQRVAIGRAIVREPAVFLFDEPLSNLDAALRVQTRGEIAALHRRLGATMVYVTHDQVEAMTLATRIAVLHQGVLQQVGPPLELYHRPANRFVASFIGSPAMSFIDGHVRRDADAIRFDVQGSLATTSPTTLDIAPASALPDIAPGPATLGLRPHALQLVSGPLGFPFVVNVIEPMGAETWLHGFFPTLPGSGAVVHHAGPPPDGLRAGDLAHVAIDLQQAHLFNTNGQTIWHGPRA